MGPEYPNDVVVVLMLLSVGHIDVRAEVSVREKDIDIQVPVASYRFVLVENLKPSSVIGLINLNISKFLRH